MKRRGWEVLAVWATLFSGCLSTQPLGSVNPGVTGYAYLEGTAAQRFTYPPQLVERALSEALADLGAHAVHRTEKADGVHFCGYLYDGRLVKVGLAQSGEGTLMRMHVDVYGDEPFSRVLIDRTSVRLATLSPAVNPPMARRAFTDSATHRGQDLEGYRGAPLR